jgi:lipid A 4'-phosphatase
LDSKKDANLRARQEWYRDLLIPIGVILGATVIFWLTDLDVRVSRLFFVPGNTEHPWIHGNLILWRMFYRSDTYLTVVLGAASVGYILAGLTSRRRRTLALYGLYILFSASIGSGLLVNEVFKEHWGRPRPDAISEFGGSQAYLPPLAKGPAGGGESFPSGHASIGFSYLVFWFIWKGRRPRLAKAALIGAVALGSLLGLGRMIQGRHFLSDVLWAAAISYLACFLLYRLMVRLQIGMWWPHRAPDPEDRPPGRTGKAA